MPRTVPDTLVPHLAAHSQTLCWLLKIAPKIAPSFGMTSLDVDLGYDDGTGVLTYAAATGFDPFDVQTANDLSVNNSQANTIAGAVYNVGMTLDGIARGDYDDAEFALYLIDYEHLADGHAVILTGRVGQVTVVNDAQCQIELRSLTDILKQSNLIGLTSITDRAMLGDDHNKVTLRWYDGTVGTVGAESDRVFSSDVAPGSSEGSDGGVLIPFPTPNDGWTVLNGSLTQNYFDGRYYQVSASSHNPSMERVASLPAGVQAGDRIKATAYIEGDAAGGARTIEMFVSFPGFDDTGAATTSPAAPNLTSWDQITCTGTVPSGATQVKVSVAFAADGGNGGLNIRDVQLRDLDYAAAGTGSVTVLGVPFFTGDGTATTAQLLDTAGDVITSGFTVQSIEVDGTPLDGADYTVSETGLVTFTTAPTGAVTWSGTLETQASGYFAPGVVHWDSGWNAGLEREVESYDAGTGTITLAIPAPFAIRTGDQFRIRRDYDGSMTQAINDFDCLLNFRGEPWLPRGNAIDLQAPTPRQS